jgi:D-tyrosyl-tRNA(Tyr) deacylase
LLADRRVGLRVFADAEGKMNLALREVGGELLVVSQFTLMGDTRRGRRPSFVAAAAPERANALIERVVEVARGLGVKVATGRFGAHMDIDVCADGPVTLLLDTKERRSDA